MTGSQGSGYSGPPSTPSAPPAPASYSGQQGWDQAKYNPGLPGQSLGPPSYSSGPPSYGSAPSSYSSATPSLSYSDSIRSQYTPQSSFNTQRPPATSPYGEPSSYGQPPTPNTYGQQPSFKQDTYGKPSVSQSPYSEPSKLTSSYQSVPGYGQPPSPSGYGQPPAPSAYGQPSTPSSYAQPTPSTYGQPSHLASFGKPVAPGAPSYGQPSSQYGQPYGQPAPYPQSSYPPAYGGNPYGQAFRPKPQFPPGTDPEIIRAFEMGDVDGSGLIDAAELGRVLSQGLPFSIRTVHLMLHMYNPTRTNSIGPTEFVTLWRALKEWKVCFERFDRDRSGRIDTSELRDGLLSMGYAISPALLEILISKYDRTGQNRAIDYDNFVDCGLVVKGLTDRFKAKDTRYTGSATLDYETFMTMVLPFIVA